MRLISTDRHELHEFEGQQIPEYAILSHCWESNEVSYHDFLLGVNRQGTGWQKIIDACNVAKHRHGYAWLWIDTCCIDKKSSAELSEAINSMYDWYASAQICIVYLSDVMPLEEQLCPDLHLDFRSSKWFLRGWTLQELLAPSVVEFHTSAWEAFGCKKDHYRIHSSTENSLPILNPIINAITGIPEAILDKSQPRREYCAAARMSWASKRQTTRPEDEAYCLMGLLDINMPLLYGEGRKAFVRLQAEVLKSFLDESILCWNTQETVLLPKAPSAFADMSEIVGYSTFPKPRLSMQSGLIILKVSEDDHYYLLKNKHCSKLVIPLQCGWPGTNAVPASARCVIQLVPLTCGHFSRVTPAQELDTSRGISHHSGNFDITRLRGKKAFYIRAEHGKCCYYPTIKECRLADE